MTAEDQDKIRNSYWEARKAILAAIACDNDSDLQIIAQLNPVAFMNIVGQAKNDLLQRVAGRKICKTQH